jgi:ribose 5-phosphate isomerase B
MVSSASIREAVTTAHYSETPMSRQTVAVAADHGGFALKELLKEELVRLDCDIIDLGTDSEQSVDYPDYGHALGEAVAAGRATCGVAVCGSGIGISIAANRHGGVRAALCENVSAARLARQHNDANILALGARLIGNDVALECLRVFLATEFEGGRHARRVEKLG